MIYFIVNSYNTIQHQKNITPIQYNTTNIGTKESNVRLYSYKIFDVYNLVNKMRSSFLLNIEELVFDPNVVKKYYYLQYNRPIIDITITVNSTELKEGTDYIVVPDDLNTLYTHDNKLLIYFFDDYNNAILTFETAEIQVDDYIDFGLIGEQVYVKAYVPHRDEFFIRRF